jgi:hypothetical protein
MANCADKYIGLFSTPEEAATAYDHAAARKFGGFAHLNFAARCKKTGSTIPR